MIIQNPIYEKIKIPDTVEEILAEIKESEELSCGDEHSCAWLQAYIDALNEGLDIINREGAEPIER